MARPTQVKKEVVQTTTRFTKKVLDNEIIVQVQFDHGCGGYEVLDCTNDTYDEAFNFSFNEKVSIDSHLAKLECLKACLEHIKTLQND